MPYGKPRYYLSGSGGVYRLYGTCGVAGSVDGYISKYISATYGRECDRGCRGFPKCLEPLGVVDTVFGELTSRDRPASRSCLQVFDSVASVLVVRLVGSEEVGEVYVLYFVIALYLSLPAGERSRCIFATYTRAV